MQVKNKILRPEDIGGVVRIHLVDVDDETPVCTPLIQTWWLRRIEGKRRLLIDLKEYTLDRLSSRCLHFDQCHHALFRDHLKLFLEEIQKQPLVKATSLEDLLRGVEAVIVTMGEEGPVHSLEEDALKKNILTVLEEATHAKWQCTIQPTLWRVYKFTLIQPE